MRRYYLGWLACALVAAGALAGNVRPLQAAEASLAGKWKVTMALGGKEYTLWLIKVSDKGGKPKATMLSIGDPMNFKDSKITKFEVKNNAVHMNFAVAKIGANFPITVYLPDGGKTPKKLLGSTEFRGLQYTWMEKTDKDELDPKKSVTSSPSLPDLQKAFGLTGDEEKEKAYRAVEKKYPEDPFAQFATFQLLSLMANKKDVKEADIRALAGRVIKLAARYGPEMKIQVVSQVASGLARSKKTATLALEYVHTAQKSLGESPKFDDIVPLLQVEESALRQAGKKEEADKVDARIDQEHLKHGIPFKPEPFTGRKPQNNRTVVLEIFTGTECPPCVAADIAFDALLKTYKSKDVVLLQYHLHIPRPDPLTNMATENRQEFYNVNSTPSIFIDGKHGPAAGGFRPQAKSTYEALRTAVNKQLETTDPTKLQLSATQKGEQINITADVSGLGMAGEGVRLRFVLVQEMVRYVGSNGQRFHHHVVRDFPGGEKGFALDKKSVKKTAKVDLGALKKSLEDYLADKRFPKTRRPVDLKGLMVVALIQDDKSKEILQAAQVHLAGEK